MGTERSASRRSSAGWRRQRSSRAAIAEASRALIGLEGRELRRANCSNCRAMSLAISRTAATKRFSRLSVLCSSGRVRTSSGMRPPSRRASGCDSGAEPRVRGSGTRARSQSRRPWWRRPGWYGRAGSAAAPGSGVTRADARVCVRSRLEGHGGREHPWRRASRHRRGKGRPAPWRDPAHRERVSGCRRRTAVMQDGC